MKFITFLNLVSKATFTLLTFIVIRNADDYIYANFLQGIGALAAGIISMLIVKKNFGLKYRIAAPFIVFTELQDSFPIFISNFATNIYMNINIIVLKFIATEEIVGMYSVAEKVFVATKHVVSAIFQAVYPFACKLKEESTEKLNIFFTRFAYFTGSFFLLSGIGIYWFAEEIIFVLAKEVISYSTEILKLMAFIPFIISLGIPAFQTNLISGFKKSFTIVMISAMIISLISNLIFTYVYSAFGTVLSIAITETFVMISLNAVVYNKERITYFKPSKLLAS
jgi:PST family polysaccharide transporter